VTPRRGDGPRETPGGLTERGSAPLRVPLVDNDRARAQAVRAGLEAAGLPVVALASAMTDLTGLVRASEAEVIVCDLDDPSRDALESMRALNRDEPRPIVVFAERGEADQIEAALEAGVAAYVVEGLAPARVRPVLEVAIRRFRAHQALRAQLETTRPTLGERTLIKRAKVVLMQRRRLPEEEAQRFRRRWAMDRGRHLVKVAQGPLLQKRA
jgi:response regulator NasT